MSDQALNIYQSLLRICQTFEGSENLTPAEQLLEESILKKHKVGNSAGESSVSLVVHQIGYKSSDFRKIKKYRINPSSIPELGSDFEEALRVQVPAHHGVSGAWQSGRPNQLRGGPIFQRTNPRGLRLPGNGQPLQLLPQQQ